MPANTPRGFPYPLPAEPVAEGAQAIRNLAEAIDAKDAGRELAYVERTTALTLGTSPTVIVTAPAITLDGSTRVLIEFFASAWNFTATSANSFLDLWEAAMIARLAQLTNSTGAAAIVLPVYGRWYTTPTAGAHTYSARGWANTGSITLQAGAAGSTYVPAFLRVSRA